MKKIIYIIIFSVIFLILLLNVGEINGIDDKIVFNYTEEQTKFIKDNKDKIFTVAIEGTENVTTFKNEDSYGIDYHVLDLLKEELGFSFEVIPQVDIPTFLKSIELQSYDIYLGPNKSEEREKTVSFMPVMFFESYHVYVNLDHQHVFNLLETGTHKIGVIENDYIIPIILKKYKINESKLFFYKTRDELIKAIESSEVDIIISAIDISDKLENSKEAFELRAEKTALSRISVNNKNSMLIEVINIAARKIINSTDLNKIKDEVMERYIIIEFLNNLNDQEREYLNKADVIHIPFTNDINAINNILNDFSKTIKKPIEIQNKLFESNKYLYSEKVANQELIAISNNRKKNISNVHELECYKLGTYKGSSVHKFITENEFFNKIKIYADFEKMKEALLKDKIDLIIMDDYDYAKYLSTQNNDSLYIVGENLYKIEIKIPFNNSDDMLVSIFNKYLKCYGDLEEIILEEKTENLRIHQEKKDFKIIAHTILGVVFLIILFGLIIYYIKKLKLNLFNEKKYRKKLIYDDATGLFNIKGISEQIDNYCNRGIPYAIIAYDFHFMKNSEDIYDGVIAKKMYIYLSKNFREILKEHVNVDIGLLNKGEMIVLLSGYEKETLIDNYIDITLESFNYSSFENNIIDGDSFSAGYYFGKCKKIEKIEKQIEKAFKAAHYMYNMNLDYAIKYNSDVENHFEKHENLKIIINETSSFDMIYPAYQFIYSGEKDDFIGAEALARWINEDESMLSPIVFIPLVEKMNRIDLFTRLLIDKVIEDIPTLRAKYGKNFYVSVNLSPKQKLNNEFVELVNNKLISNNLDSSAIRFEITENTLVENMVNMNKFIKYARNKGFKIALDDFGTGYSSLSYLNEFDFDVVKIDRIFIKDLPNDEYSKVLVDIITELSKRLGFKLIAEGAETEENVNYILEKGNIDIQGFYYSKPTLLKDIVKM